MVNWYGLSTGEPKFSLFINNTAAAAIRPMMAGRRPLNMFCTSFESLWLIKYRLIKIMMMKGNHMIEREAINEPIQATQWE